MLIVSLDRENYEYDVHALVQAFYPEEQVKVLIPESKEAKSGEMQDSARIRIRLRGDGAMITVDDRDYPWEYTGEHSGDTPGASPEKSPAREREPYRAESYKTGFKRFLYQVLCQVRGRTLPWGNLTGIRPTKIARALLEEGRTEQEVIEYYRENYYVSREKAGLSVDIAKRERQLLDRVHYLGGYSLYIGIPFCPTTCLYCSFTSFPIAACREMVAPYLDCLTKELAAVAGQMEGKILDSVYIGGGTPTTLEAAQLDRLLGSLRELFDFRSVQEFTVEAGRADSITADKLRVLYGHGVTRISVNPQTMRQETLDLIGRKATAAQVEHAFAWAREAGFDNINMDLILGLPGETEEDVRYTIDKISALAPDSLTVHSLAVKRASRLNRWLQEQDAAGGHISMLGNTDETMEIAAQGAERLGLLPYYLYRQKNMSGNFENVGYAREGKFGLYNVLINEEVQSIAACGAGSISKRVYPDGLIRRCENVKEVSQYLARIDEMIERKRVLFED